MNREPAPEDDRRRYEMKQEAVVRMLAMGITDSAVMGFRQNGTVCISEGTGGACRTADEKQKKEIAGWENETGNLVYTAVRSPPDLQGQTAWLYVPGSRDEWPEDWENIHSGRAYVHVHDENPALSMNGLIGIRLGCFKGLVRTW